MKNPGFSVVEVIIIVLLIALLAWAVFPLLSTTYSSWETADRRAEVIEAGRVAMTQLTRETKKAWDIQFCSEPEFIDYYPQWATQSTPSIYRFASAEYEIQYGATPGAFASDALAYPVDSFSYLTYARRPALTGISRPRRVNAFRFNFAVSDERRVLPDSLDPMYFRSMSHMRHSREGYYISKELASTTQYYLFDRSDGDDFCIMVYNDRITPPPPALATQEVELNWVPGGLITLDLSYFSGGDYFATCCGVSAAECDIGPSNFTRVIVRLNDGSEIMLVEDDNVDVNN
ncbi:MAG: hypothetical protein AB1742_05995 [bacterium]